MDRNTEQSYRLATPRLPHDEKHNAEVKNERLSAIKNISPLEEKEKVLEEEEQEEERGR